MIAVKRVFVAACISVLVLTQASTVKALVIKSGGTTYFEDQFEGALGPISAHAPSIGTAWIEDYTPPQPAKTRGKVRKNRTRPLRSKGPTF